MLRKFSLDDGKTDKRIKFSNRDYYAENKLNECHTFTVKVYSILQIANTFGIFD